MSKLLRRRPSIAVGVLILLVAPAAACALDHVTFRRDSATLSVTGKVLVKAQDGGLLVVGRDGRQWLVEPDKLIRHTSDEKPFVPLSTDEAAKALAAELPEGFSVHSTAHYAIVFNTSREYAQWCGALLERLYSAFHTYWNGKGIELHQPEFPLLVIVCADAPTWQRVAGADLGGGGQGMIGYYNLLTNRVLMQDLTGLEALRERQGRPVTRAAITAMLRRPAAQNMVATVVHEATHQIANNCGLHERMTDIPFWLAEGLAMYFESPDLSGGRGWTTIGKVNRPRLVRFRQYLRKRPADSLSTLLTEDKRFRDPDQALDAYAEAWALTYYLARSRSDEYLEYLKLLAKKDRLIWDKPQQRLAEFKAAFGGDLEQFDHDFLRYIRRVR